MLIPFIKELVNSYVEAFKINEYTFSTLISFKGRGLIYQDKETITKYIYKASNSYFNLMGIDYPSAIEFPLGF